MPGTGNLRIVVVTQHAPDPFGNSAARWYYVLLKGLSERGHHVSCWSAEERPEFLERARRHFERTARVDLHVVPAVVRRRRLATKLATLRQPFSYSLSEGLRDGVRRTLDKGYDVLHLEQLWCGYLGLGVPRTLVSVHHLQLLDLCHTGLRSWSFLKSKLLAWRAERRLLRRFADIRVTTPRLARVVARINAQARIRTVPVAIDPTLYSFRHAPSRTGVVGLIAGMNWEPGYNAALRLLERIWPRVRVKAPDAHLLVGGWGARRALAAFLDEPGVTIREDLKDPAEFWNHCSILAYPLTRGSGMKLKVLEAMALGVPVITTNEGIEGIRFEQGVHAFVEDNDDAFAERVVELLRDSESCRRMMVAARTLVEERYSPGPTVGAIINAYSELVT